MLCLFVLFLKNGFCTIEARILGQDRLTYCAAFSNLGVGVSNPLLDSELPESLPMEEHVAEVKKLMDIAERELFRAKEKCRKDNTERGNAVRRDEHFLVGGKVLFYNRLAGDEKS